jgi:acyl-coenzyme A thioesterase PaaI-like protein
VKRFLHLGAECESAIPSSAFGTAFAMAFCHGRWGGIVVSCPFPSAASCAKWPVFDVQQRIRPAGIAAALLNPMTNSSAPDGIQRRFQNTQAEAHPFCFVCSGSNPMGLALRYAPQPDGSVSANYLGHCALEGYPGLLHGGVIAALLDGAMTNCLFALGQRALTVELKVCYHAGVAAAEETLLRAWLEDDSHGLFQLRAELRQGGTVKASATGKFMELA